MLNLKGLAEVVVRNDEPFGVMSVTRTMLLELINRALASEDRVEKTLIAGLELSREVTALEVEVTALNRHLAHSEARRCKHSPIAAWTTRSSSNSLDQVSGLLSQVKAMDEDRKTLRAELEAARTELRLLKAPADRLRSFVGVKQCPPFVDGICVECGRMPHACGCPAE